jgi:3-oxoacyl-[acyl-carrier-protein] synthase-3
MNKTVIIGTGSYIPAIVKKNSDFHSHAFYADDNTVISSPPEVITSKFQEITGIEERRYADPGQVSSDIALFAAREAISDAGIDPETLDQIIYTHNYGDIPFGTSQSDTVPALAARLKHKLGIKNPSCVAYDLLFGCPGWVQGVIHTDAFFKAGVAQRILVVGSETLSRVIDDFDRDSMIFSDGAGAAVLEYKDVPDDTGILSCAAVSHCFDEVDYINFGCSYKPGEQEGKRFIKMKGRKVYEYAIKYVPSAISGCLEKAGIDLLDVKKFFIHQANEKLDEGIIRMLFKQHGHRELPVNIMPMNIHKLGNSSVATVPTLFDMVRKGKIEGHSLAKGDLVVFAAVGAGMHINAVAYRV